MPADIATSLKDWSTTASSNLPSGSTAISTNLDDNLRQLQTVVRYLAASDSIASATTTDIGSKDATFLTISGTTTITGLGTVSAGIYKWVVFSGALTLTHNGTSLILPTGANLTTAANDTALFLSLGSGNWRCVSYNRANGLTVLGAQSFADGTVSAPSITFTSDNNTGFYRIGADQFGAAANGSNIATFGTTSVTIPTLTSTTINATTINGPSQGDLTFDINQNYALKFAWPVSMSHGATKFLEGSSTGVVLKYSGVSYLNVGSVGGVLGVHAYERLQGFDGFYVEVGNSSNQDQVVKIDATNANTNAIYISTTAGGAIWRVSKAGATFADGSYSSSGADYSEAFLYTGAQPQPGDTVTLDGDKVRLATQGDEVIGVISEKPAFIGDQKLVDQGGVVVGLVGKLKVNPGCPVDSRWRLLDAQNNVYLVR